LFTTNENIKIILKTLPYEKNFKTEQYALAAWHIVRQRHHDVVPDGQS